MEKGLDWQVGESIWTTRILRDALELEVRRRRSLRAVSGI